MIGHAVQAMGANVKMAETMGATSKVMADMNKMMNPQQVGMWAQYCSGVLKTYKTGFFVFGCLKMSKIILNDQK